LTNTFKYLQIL